MQTIFSPITKFFNMLYDIFFNFVVSMGISEESGLAYVLAVVLLTVLIRLCLLPFNIKSARSTQKMQEIQPEIKRIQEKYKNDPQKANMEIMRIYKEKNVSMTGGCLPSLLPLPILMALYYVFWPMDLAGKSFLWIADLGAPDPYFILPVLSALMTYLPTYLMTKAQSTNTENPAMNMGAMNIGMSLMMGFMALNFKSILVIYWIVGGVIQLANTYFINYRPAMKKQKEIKIIEEEKEAARVPKFVMAEYEETNKASKKKNKKK